MRHRDRQASATRPSFSGSVNDEGFRSDMKTQLFTHEQARRPDASDGTLGVLANWLTSYAMNDHADLGRPGTVCPFVKRAARLETLRLGISLAGSADEAAVYAEIRSSFEVLNQIPAPGARKQLRTITIGFPRCASDEGIAMLARVTARHKYYTLLRSRMLALFHEGSDLQGLWNPAFRPLRSPMPMIAVRYLVEQDAGFVAKHKLLIAPYLLRFGPAGARRLASHWRRRASMGAVK